MRELKQSFGMSPAVSALQPMRELQARCAADHAKWVEDVLAGLLINGVSSDEIEVQQHDGGLRTVVIVRGEKMYERALSYTIKGSE